MHELSITQGIIEICEKCAAGRRVLSLEVEIGALSSVVAEAVEFCFDACSAGTLLEGARLNIVRMPGRGQCDECSAGFTISSMPAACPDCNSYRITIVSGDEMRVREIEVE